MVGAVGVPDPVVGIEGDSAVVVDFPVIGAEVAAILAEADGAFVGAVEGGVEHLRVVGRAPFDRDFAKGLVPYPASFGGHGVDVITLYFAVEIPAGLLGADQRYAVAEVDLAGGCGKLQGGADVASLRFGARPVDRRAGEDARFLGSLTELDAEIYRGVVA